MRIDITKITSVKISALIIAALITLIAAGPFKPASAQRSPRPRANAWAPQQSSDNPKANSAFTAARDLIDDAQWAKAEAAFNQYIASYAKENNVDAAMYWMAYAQYQQKNFDKTRDTVEKLLKTYQKTIWKQDAELLVAQLPGSTAPKATTLPATPDIATVNGEAIAQIVEAATPAAANVDAAVAQSLAQAAVAAPEQQERLVESQERMAQAKARADERTKEAQERTMDRLKEAQEKMKEKTAFKYSVDSVGYGAGYGVGYGVGFPGEKLADDDPCEFKIVVLQSLVESDEARGVAAATEWLKPNSSQGPPCRRAALSVLARHGGKASLPTILSVAQSDPDFNTRVRAISLLGMTNDDSVIDPLLNFVLNSTQNQITEAAMFALGQHNSPRALTALSEIAISNKPLPLRKMAISSIAGRQGEPAVDALFNIYDKSQDVEVRKSVINGLARRRSDRAGARLLEIAHSSDNVELRKAAILAIGRRGGDGVIDTLINLYGSEANAEIKDQIINSLSYSKDPRVTRKLISIARDPQTPIERRRRIVMMLAGRKDPEAVQFLEELVKQ